VHPRNLIGVQRTLRAWIGIIQIPDRARDIRGENLMILGHAIVVIVRKRAPPRKFSFSVILTREEQVWIALSLHVDDSKPPSPKWDTLAHFALPPRRPGAPPLI
jgi:hypothetical protein